MKVLIISANKFPFSPCGPAYVAGAARDAGHEVAVFDCLFAENTTIELKQTLDEFNPKVVGVSIRTVAGKIRERTPPNDTVLFDNRLLVKEVITCIKTYSTANIIIGGPGFNYYGEDWLNYLDLDYGLRGECELSFPLYLDRLEDNKDIYDIPGCVYKKNDLVQKVKRQQIANLDDTSLPAYDLFNLDKYVDNRISAGIFSKKGCAFHCTYCPYTPLEGKQYRLKSPKRVVDEIEFITSANPKLRIEFNDNSFNAPRSHADAICEEMLNRGISTRWGTGNLKPMGITDAQLTLFKNSGCIYLNLSMETGSEKMLNSMNKGFSIHQIQNALTCLSDSGIPFSVSLMFGAPGETPETVSETLAMMNRFPKIMAISATIGINLWTHHQQIVADLIQDGQLSADTDLFDEQNYIAPELPKEYMLNLIENLKQRENYMVQVNMPYTGYKWDVDGHKA